MSGPPEKKTKFNDNKSNKPKFNYRPKKKSFLEVGQRGFFATCNFQERECVRECYNVLNRYANELYGPEEELPTERDNASVESDQDITDNLQNEVQQTNGSKQQRAMIKRRFTYVNSGANNCIFIRSKAPVEPIELGSAIIKSIAESGDVVTRHLLRLIPIEVVCHAELKDIVEKAGPLFDKHFLKQPATFAIIYNKRFNNSIKRDDIIRELAELVQGKNVGNRVNLREPEKTVIVEIVKGLCLMTVLTDYMKYKKFNLFELTNKSHTKNADEQKKSEAEPIELNAGGGNTDMSVDDISSDDKDKPKQDVEQINANDG